LTGRQFLRFVGNIREMPSAPLETRIAELMAFFHLDDAADSAILTYSMGMKRKLGLASAVLHRPKVLILDEPTSGLDPHASRDARALLVSLRDAGTTVFLTTHNIEEADELCHRVAIINKGRIAAIDTPRSLRATVQSRRSVEVRFAQAVTPPEAMLDLGTGTETVKFGQGFRVFGVEPGLIAQELANRATAQGLRIEHLSTLEPSLEEVFLHITSRGLAAPAGGIHA